MRLNINLASRKYEDVRRFFVRWSATLAMLAALAGLLTGLAYWKHSNAVQAEKQTRRLEQEIADLEKQRNQRAEEENRPENRDVTQQKKFWNNQIAKRSFSWTQLFNDLQKIMPNRAYLNSVQPELTPDNRLKLRLVITGEKKDNALELQEKMETSSRFHSPQIMAENPEKEARPGMPSTYKFEIETFYTPAAPLPSPPAHPGAKEGA